MTTPPLTVLPLITQSHLLRNLNIAARLEKLVNSALDRGLLSEEAVGVLIDNATRLVEPDASKGGMGEHFKCMAVVSSALAPQGADSCKLVPFDFPDERQKKLDAEHEERSRKGTTRTIRGLLDVQPHEQQPSYLTGHTKQAADSAAAPAASATAATTGTASPSTPPDHFFSSVPPLPTPAPKPEPGTTAHSTSARRAAAREAAAELARARAKREAEEAAAGKKK